MSDLAALRDFYRGVAADKHAIITGCETAMESATGHERESLAIRADRARELLKQCAAVLDLLGQYPGTILRRATLAALRYRLRADFWEEARRKIAEAIKTETDT